MKYKHIILGGDGFIASELKEKISGNFISLAKRKKKNTYQCDFVNNNKWFKFIGNKSIIYFFGYENNLYKFEEDYKNLIISYYKFLRNLSIFLKKKKIKPTIIFMSTVTVYGMRNTLCKETSPILPISWYDNSKVLVEKMLHHLSAQNLCTIIILRLSNVFGINKNSKQNNRGFINKVILSIKHNTKPVILYNRGKYFRDYINVNDVISAVLVSVKKIKLTKNKIFNVCSGKSYLIYDVVKIIYLLNKTKKKIISKTIPNKFHRIEKRNFFGSNKSFRLLTGWKTINNLKKDLYDIIISL